MAMVNYCTLSGNFTYEETYLLTQNNFAFIDGDYWYIFN